MKTIAKMAGALALLASSASMAATVVVTPSDANPLAGTSFSVIVHGDGFPSTAGATLGLSWNTAAASVTAITLAAGSPFTGGVVAAAPWNPISILGPLVGTLPSGSFDSFNISFSVNAGAAPGTPLNIVLTDDQTDLCWSDAVTFGCVEGVQYTQANVTVGGAVVPAPAAAWLIAPAVLAAGRFSRRRKAA